jgi:hypothetical protein
LRSGRSDLPSAYEFALRLVELLGGLVIAFTLNLFAFAHMSDSFCACALGENATRIVAK